MFAHHEETGDLIRVAGSTPLALFVQQRAQSRRFLPIALKSESDRRSNNTARLCTCSSTSLVDLRVAPHHFPVTNVMKLFPL